MEQFSKLIGVSLDAAYDIEKSGLIKARHVGMPKMGKIVSKEAAHQFNHTYIASTAIAKQICVSSNTVIKWLAHAGIKPVAGPSVDGGPRYLYLRKDLADFDIKTIKPSRRAKKQPTEDQQIPLFKNAA